MCGALVYQVRRTPQGGGRSASLKRKRHEMTNVTSFVCANAFNTHEHRPHSRSSGNSYDCVTIHSRESNLASLAQEGWHFQIVFIELPHWEVDQNTWLLRGCRRHRFAAC